MRYLYLSITLAVAIAHAQEVIWVRNGETSESHFGQSIYPLGDQNQDGYSDWMISSPGGAGGFDDRVDFFYGGNPPSQAPYLTFHPRPGTEAPYMYNRRPIGDFNGDGIIDWVIGYWIPGLDSATFEFNGGGQGTDTIPEAILKIPYEVGQERIARLGDHNGDGFDDIYFHDNDLDLTYIYFGAFDWNMSVDLINQGEPIGSDNADPSVEVYGDFNGDGFDDYTARTGSHTYFYWGSADPDTVPDIEWAGNFAFPATLSVDMNSDGFADLAVGRYQTIDVHLGSQTPSFIPTFVLDFPGCSEGTVSSLISAGDYNNDGYDDLVTVSQACANGFGALQLYLGGPWLNPYPVLRIEGMSSPPFNNVPIWRAIGLGDVNGDGIDDLAIGCQRDINDGRRGRVVILSGDTTLHIDASEHPPLAQDFSMSVYPNPVNGVATIRIEQPLGSKPSELAILNLLGQTVNRFTLAPGTQSLAYDASALASGIYIIQAQSLSNIVSQKLVVLK